MANVPEVRQDRVGPAPLPGRRLSIDAPLEAFGGGSAVAGPVQQLQGLADDEVARQQKERERYDGLAFQAADTDLAERENALLHDPTSGALVQRTADPNGALTLADKVQKDFDLAVQESQKKLSNDAQRQAFKARAADRRADVRRSVMRYADQEIDRHDGEALKTGLSAAYTEALQNAGDRTMVEKAIGRQMGALVAYAQRHKVTDAVLDAQIAEEVSRTHRGVIEALVNAKQTGLARERLEFYESELQGDDLTRARSLVKTGETLGEATRIGDEILEKFESRVAGDKEAAKIEDPSLRREVEQYLDYQRGRRTAAETADRHALVSSALNDVYNKVRPGASAAEVVGLERWERMDAKDKDSVVKVWREANGLDVERKSDPYALGQTYKLSRSGALAEYTLEQIQTEFLPKLGRQDYEQLLGRWETSTKAKTDALAKAKWEGLLKDDERIFDALKGTKMYGLKPGDTMDVMDDKKDTDGKKSSGFQAFRRLVDREYRSFHPDGKEPSTSEKETILARLAYNYTKEVTLKRYDLGVDWMDSDEVRRIAELTDAELDTEEFAIEPKHKTALFNMAHSTANLLPAGMTEASFFEKYRGRVNRAFVAGLRGESDQRIKDILSGR